VRLEVDGEQRDVIGSVGVLVPGTTIDKRCRRKGCVATHDGVVVCLDLLGSCRYSCKAGHVWEEGHLQFRQGINCLCSTKVEVSTSQ